MRFRAKLLLACLPLALAPLAFFGLRVRDEVTVRLASQYEERVAALADVVEADLAREASAVDARLERVARAMAADNRFRRAVLDGHAADRTYLLDYAGQAMALGGLDVLRIQDEHGRVLSSGHFRNEYDAVDPGLSAAVAHADGEGTLVTVPTATGPLLALARARQVTVGPRTLTLMGGTAVDPDFLDRMAHGTGLEVRLELPDNGVATDGGPDREAPVHETVAAAGSPREDEGRSAGRQASAASRDGSRTDHGRRAPGYTREVVVRYIDGGGSAIDGGESTLDGRPPSHDAVVHARFVVHASTAPVDAIRRDMDRWLAAMLALTGALAVFFALAIATRLSRPLAELARKTGRLDLDRLDVKFETGRADEIGALSRVLDRMAYRLRIGAARLREAERRATVGEIARQVNHDVRNGLTPIRNVVSHLAQLAHERPDELPAVFLERKHTLESSIDYLHNLAGNYARLSPVRDSHPCDLNAIVREVVRDSPGRMDGAGPEIRVAGHDGSTTRDRRTVRTDGGNRAARTAGDDVAATTPGDRAAIRILTDLAPRLPPVHADPVALRRIVENLVVNAVESLEGNGGSVTVSTRLERARDAADGGRGVEPQGARTATRAPIRTQRARDDAGGGRGVEPRGTHAATRSERARDRARIRLIVADTGRGMDAEERARIFQDFYTTKPSGTGLGLSIVRRLVSDLEGRITVESEPGAGTRFTIELPTV